MKLKKIKSIQDFKNIQKFFGNNTPYSDFSPISLMSWSHGKGVFYSLTERGVVLKMPTYLIDNYVFAAYLLNSDSTFHNELKSLSSEYHYIPEHTLQYFPNEVLKIRDRDSYDYIYSTKNLINMGKHSNNLAKRIHKFECSSNSITYRVIDVKQHLISKSLFSLCEEWCLYKGFKDDEIKHELNALAIYIRNSEFIKDFSIGVFQKDKLLGYTLNELHGSDWCIGHFGKATHVYKDLSLMSEIYTAKLLSKLGVRYINHQQDTGILSLRAFKESLNPIKYLKKYIVKFSS